MPKKSAGERAPRIARAVAASTCAAVLAVAAGACGTDDNGYDPTALGTDTSTGYGNYDSSAPVDTSTYIDTSTYSDTSTYDDTSTYGGTSTYGDTSTYGAGDNGNLPNSSPYAVDTCFSGPYITSTTAIDPGNMNEVDCGSSDAHYKVIQTFLESTDLNKCNDVDGSQYAFSEQETDGYGLTTWEAVYCLVGLGSYAAG